jgi:catechol 2,3-dioxygenase-like lactoylglutathione lyase family enzyme
MPIAHNNTVPAPRLNHANLPVADVAGLRAFFVRHFAFAEVATRGRDALAVLRGADGFVLNLMRAAAPSAGYPRNFHVGFFVDTPEAVRAKHAELRAAGLAPSDVEALARGGFASVTFYCEAPGGVLVEVSCATEDAA